MKTLKEIWIEAMLREGFTLDELNTESFDKEITGFVIGSPNTQIKDVVKATKIYHFEEDK